MYKRYKKDFPYSYVEGIYPTLELIDTRVDLIKEILISEAYTEKESLIKDLEKKEIPYKIDDKSINRISKKGNNYLIGVFNKQTVKVEDKKHILLDKPSNMGNLGTIIRTMLGFGYHDLVITGESCDIFDPRVIRSSMGAFFKLRIEEMDSIRSYKEKFPNKNTYLFMLGEKSLLDIKKEEDHVLVFGNEGSGLAEEEKEFGQAVMIPQSPEIDSFNLPISAAIAMFYFNS